MTHWTGPKHRLDRDLSGHFGSSSYAVEELVAELGASFLCAQLGIRTEPRRDHAPYIKSWLDVLRADPRALVSAASQAQAAVEFLIAHSPTSEVAVDALARKAA
jgi:antirestriction protein ArdC